jgi:NDP-sugar pyrophosphorylase family protein
MLDVAGRKVIEYSLEDLAASGLTDALLVSAHTEQIEKFVGDGSRWGLKISYLLSRGEQSPAEVISRIKLDNPVLMVRADVVRGPAISSFLETALNENFESLTATQDGRDTGLCLVRQEWVHGASWPAGQIPFMTFEVGDVGYHALDSLYDFHAASIEIADGRMKDISLPGRVAGPGLVAARLSQVDASSVASGSLFVGSGAKVDSSVQTSGTVVIGDRALVDEGALIKDTVILPDSYVGKNLELKHAIVAGNKLIRVDREMVVEVKDDAGNKLIQIETETVAEISDDFLLASLIKSRRPPSVQSGADRLLAALLLVMSLPLWPVAALIALVSNPRSPIVSSRLLSNRSNGKQLRSFNALRWNTAVPILRGLPLLFAVVAGHLRLVGVRPCATERSYSNSRGTPAGLLGPALTDVSNDAPEEEIWLSESMFTRSDVPLKRINYLFKSMAALGSRRSWSPAGRYPAKYV